MAVKKTKKSKSQSKSSPAKKGTAGGSGAGDGEAASTASGATAAPTAKGKLRVRMYRVGFGDFFMLTVTGPSGAKHILIDCGVHAKDIGTIQDAVAQMQKDCDSRLSLVIMTHRHADHISGFGKCSDIFSQITVDRVWMPWFENPENKPAAAFQAGLTALAGRLTMRLAARNDPESEQFISMADNITGGLSVAGISANQKALDVLHNGFKNKPEHDYYQAGDPPKLPQDLIDAGLTAQILGPPIDPSLISQMTSKSQQYLAEAAEPDDAQVKPPFSDAFRTDAKAYPAAAFTFYKPDEITKMVDESQPDVLAAKAQGADNTLNNQSLVVLFSAAGKNLLFAGDAQWGNWENFLYGGRYGTPGHMDVTKTATDILGKIDFYKVGHHGSANATPKGAVAAMRHGCVGMCSTQILAYPGVPRDPLLTALSDRMDGQLARSDQAMISSTKWDNPKAGPVPSRFKHSSGTLYIDYEP
ncbi:MAG TPA: MBL fold metallo-hydrolase [Bradyrhizobium sp.]|nr:MBL fold metallo-hydrolase [Bradyrhizobium sp.]